VSALATSTGLGWAVVLVGLVVGFGVQVAAHELGHLLAAVALRLPVLGVRVGPLRSGLSQKLPGTFGHVQVDLSRVRRWLPGRMVLLALAGPLANLALTAAALVLVGSPDVPVGLRPVVMGTVLAGAILAVANLMPLATAKGVVSDGRQALSWLVHPSRERAGVHNAVDITRLREAPGRISAGLDRRAQLRASVDDPRADVAVAAMAALVRSTPRGSDGWADVAVMEAFGSRGDVAGDQRAAYVGNHALALGLALVKQLRTKEANGRQSAQLHRVAELAELAYAADRHSAQARAALGLVRVLQNQPVEARSVVVDVSPSASPVLRARALAVRVLAELQLGEYDEAARLLEYGRQLAPGDALVVVAGTVLASGDVGRAGLPGRAGPWRDGS
jgi:hypothetical protein